MSDKLRKMTTSKNLKTALFASLIAAMILPFSSTSMLIPADASHFSGKTEREPFVNFRGETVYLFPASSIELYARGYLDDNPTYCSHFTLVDYGCQSESRIFTGDMVLTGYDNQTTVFPQ